MIHRFMAHDTDSPAACKRESGGQTEAGKVFADISDQQPFLCIDGLHEQLSGDSRKRSDIPHGIQNVPHGLHLPPAAFHTDGQ